MVVLHSTQTPGIIRAIVYVTEASSVPITATKGAQLANVTAVQLYGLSYRKI